MVNIDVNRPVSEYGAATPYFKRHAEYLRGDLAENRLEVTLRPAPEPQFIGHQVRHVVNQNPSWYQEFYAEPTNVERQRTMTSLERIVLEDDKPSDEHPFATYHGKVRRLIHEHLRDGYTSESGVVPPRNDYREVVGLPRVQHGYRVDGVTTSTSRDGVSERRTSNNDLGENCVASAPF